MTLNIPQADRMGVGGYVRYARTKIPSCVRNVFSGKKEGCPFGFGFLIFIQEGTSLSCLSGIFTGTFCGSSEFVSPRISREKYSVTACVDP